MTKPAWATNEICQRCFDLAWFCKPENHSALEIVKRSLAKLEVTIASQDKRRKDVGKQRNRVILADMNVLQRLVLTEAEIESAIRDRGGFIADSTEMIVRWLSFLARQGFDNSFVATVGVSRIIHTYSTAAAHNFYAFLVQDPSRDKDDDKYRRVKSRLHDKLARPLW